MISKILKYIGILFGVLCFLTTCTIVLLRWVNPPITAFTLQVDWDRLDQEFYNLRTNWIPYYEIPESMIWAVVASEDQLFFEHHGFDFESIEDAWQEHRQGVRTRGASTISQQVAKNLFLSPAQSFIRKGVEAALTVGIELLWPKERILEIYLNIAEFGPGIFGIGKASLTYFNSPATQLTPERTARLAAVLPSPARMRVNPPSPYTEERSRWILQQMRQLTGNPYQPARNLNSDTKYDPSDTRNLTPLPDTMLQSLPDTVLLKSKSD